MRTIRISHAKDLQLRLKALLDVENGSILDCSYHHPPFLLIIEPIVVPEYPNQRFLAGALRSEQPELTAHEAELLRDEAQSIHDQLFQTSYWNFANQRIDPVPSRPAFIDPGVDHEPSASPFPDNSAGEGDVQSSACEVRSNLPRAELRRSSRQPKPRSEEKTPASPGPKLKPKEKKSAGLQPGLKPKPKPKTPASSKSKPGESKFERIADDLVSAVVCGAQRLQTGNRSLILWATDLQKHRIGEKTTLETLWKQLDGHSREHQADAFIADYFAGNVENLRVHTKGKPRRSPIKPIKSSEEWRKRLQSRLSSTMNKLIQKTHHLTPNSIRIIPYSIARQSSLPSREVQTLMEVLVSNLIEKKDFRDTTGEGIEKVTVLASERLSQSAVDWSNVVVDSSFDPISLCCVAGLRYVAS